jgi:hypothetical protein
MAEKSGSRTHQGRLTPLTGFEDRAPHQGAILFHDGFQRIVVDRLIGRSLSCQGRNDVLIET